MTYGSRSDNFDVLLHNLESEEFDDEAEAQALNQALEKLADNEDDDEGFENDIEELEDNVPQFPVPAN